MPLETRHWRDWNATGTSCSDNPHTASAVLFSRYRLTAMTSPDDGTVLADSVRQAAEAAGINGTWRLMRVSVNTVFANAAAAAVARVSRAAGDTAAVRAAIDVAVAAASAGAPVVGPLPVGVRRLRDGRPVTFWPLAAHPVDVSLSDVARLVANCHSTACPSAAPAWTPLTLIARKQADLRAAADTSLPLHHLRRVSDAWAEASTVLQDCSDTANGVLVHDDLHPGNVVAVGGELKLCDLDGLCRGIREADLSKMAFHCLRFIGAEACDEFLSGYGQPFDERLLEQMRNAREVSACVWLASLWDLRPETRNECVRRIETLKDPSQLWTAL